MDRQGDNDNDNDKDKDKDTDKDKEKDKDIDKDKDKDKDKENNNNNNGQVRDQEWAAEGAITILPKRANINGQRQNHLLSALPNL